MNTHIQVPIHIFAYDFGREVHKLPNIQICGSQIKDPLPQVKLDFVWSCKKSLISFSEGRTWMGSELVEKPFSKKLD